MDEKKRNGLLLIAIGVLVVIIGAIVAILVAKKPFRNKGNETSERKVIQLDIPGAGQTSETVEQSDGNAEIVDSTKDKVADNKEKTSEKTTTNNNKPTVIEEKASETKKAEEAPMIIIEDPNTNNSTPSGGGKQSQTTPAKSDEVIELPFVPYEALKEN